MSGPRPHQQFPDIQQLITPNTHPAVALDTYFTWNERQRGGVESFIDDTQHNPAGFETTNVSVTRDPITGEVVQLVSVNIFDAQGKEPAEEDSLNVGEGDFHAHSRPYLLKTIASRGATYGVERALLLGRRRIRNVAGLFVTERTLVTNTIVQNPDPSKRALYNPTLHGNVDVAVLSRTFLQAAIQDLSSIEVHRVTFYPSDEEDVAVTLQVKGRLEDPRLSQYSGFRSTKLLSPVQALHAAAGRRRAARSAEPGSELAATTVVLKKASEKERQDIEEAMQAKNPQSTDRAYAEVLYLRAARTARDLAQEAA